MIGKPPDACIIPRMSPTLTAYAQRVEQMSHATAVSSLSSYMRAAEAGRIPGDLQEELDAMVELLRARIDETGQVVV